MIRRPPRATRTDTLFPLHDALPISMLAQKVEDMINTVVRQIAFYEFERKLHTARKEGELTAEQIGELWLSVQEESLGPAIRISEGYANWWAYVPHFIHSPFSVYAYADRKSTRLNSSP